jgi:hypothetical protein
MCPERTLLWALKVLTNFPRKENWSGRQDLNLRPSGPKPDALPDCATPRLADYIKAQNSISQLTILKYPSEYSIMFRMIPKSILVFAVLSAGVCLLFYIQKPHSLCDSQFAAFRESQIGRLYPKKQKGGPQGPTLFKSLQQCRVLRTSGACYEFFQQTRQVLRDLKNIPNSCSQEMEKIPEIRNFLGGAIDIIVRLAWGEHPPERGPNRFGWLEPAEISIFCELKNQFHRLFGMDEWEKIRQGLVGKLPGERTVFEGGKCLNCEDLKTAAQTLSAEDQWVRSIYSVRCEDYR